MRNFSTFKKPVLRMSFIIQCVFFCIILCTTSYAQQTNIKDYVLFNFNGKCTGGPVVKPPLAPGYTVQIGSGSYIEGGTVGSFHQVRSTGAATINANIFSGGSVKLWNNNIVNGKIAAANAGALPGTILSVGIDGKLTGNIDVKGNIIISSGVVSGRVTHPSGTTYSGPVPAGGNITGVPAIPLLPKLPAITPFPGFSNIADINTSRSIEPGAYNDIKLPGNKTLTFNGTGVYVFDKIDNRGVNYFVFDFKNDPSGTFKIYVHNDADLGNISVRMINGGSASRIYTEVHGNGTGCENRIWAFNMANGHSASSPAEWLGTVWAPFGPINIGSGNGNSKVTGALWSGTQVIIQCGVKIIYAPFSECVTPNVNAGPDDQLSFLNITNLAGSSTTPGAQYSWQAINGGTFLSGANTATPAVSTAGTYILTVSTRTGCSATDTVIVSGKINNLTGSALDALYDNHDTSSALSKTIFQFSDNSVLIDVVAIQGKYNELRSLLLTPPYGLYDTVSNGSNSLIITGKFPIDHLRKLDSLGELINHVRPVYPPLGNTGLIQTPGDSAMRTNYVRNGFGVQGDGIKVGVISDSYNTLPGNPAANDVTNGDLPGLGSTVNSNPVHVLKEYPFGRGSDEGRAMLQIVHDIAPKAKLSFRTGFVTAGDFAEGIKELAKDSCNIIVDDITYITEPFFKKGVVEKAINEVSAAGVHYVAAAGNFGTQSYESVFNPANTPNGLAGRAHNFGGGDILQSDSVKGTLLTPGIYTIVLQWSDDIYSLGGSATGTQNDLDIYLADQNGTALFGVNTNNIGKDPIEILPFTVTSNSVVNIVIVNASAPAGSTTSTVRFKYIVFRGDIRINEHQLGSSTIVGHANADEAITVGAALYSNTPAFGVNPPTIASFSSTGGTLVENIVANKPDIVAPNGVNTSVNFGSIDFESDGLPNFFGTSAAAPHVAGAVALILEAKKKFNNQVISPADVKTLLHNTSINMNTPGFDFVTGYGFIQADSALRSFANPKPFISKLQLADSSLLPGVQPMELIVKGSFLSSGTKIIFGLDTLATNIISNTQATTTLPVFSDDKLITLYTLPKTNSGLDGGLSNAVSITGLAKKNITVIANNKTKKYGEQMPAYTSTILVDGDSLQHTQFTPASLGLTDILYETPATPLSNAGLYFIRPARIFEKTVALDSILLSKYNYAFTDGALNVLKLPVKIIPRDTTLAYGQKISGFNFDYRLDSSITIADPAALVNIIHSTQQGQLENNIIGLVNGKAVAIVNGKAVAIVNGQEVMIVDGKAVAIVNGKAVPIVNGKAVAIVNGKAVAIVNNLTEAQTANLSFLATTPSLQHARSIITKTLVNGNYTLDSFKVVDITQESILDFNENSAQTSLLTSVSFANARGLTDIESLTSGKAVTIVNGKAVAIVNGKAVTIVNGEAVTIVNGKAVTIVNGKAVPIVNGQGRTAVVVDETDIGQGLSPLKSINMITGLANGQQSIIPGSLLDDNLEITYGLGKLTILPAAITIKANDTTKVYGETLTLDPTAFHLSAGVLMYDDSIKQVALSSAGTGPAAHGGTHPITASNAVGGAETDLSNYSISYLDGILTVTKAPVIVKADNKTRIYGDANPAFTATYTGLLNGQLFGSSGIKGSPAFSTTATAFSRVGDYPIVVAQGTLSSPDYSFVFLDGTLSIAKACLEIKADDKVSYAGDALPAFTSMFTGLRAGDRPDVTYTVSPACTREAGVYSIIPALTPFGNAKNYTIKYTNGKLYINPKGWGAKKLMPYLDCVEELSPGNFIAHFYCINDNKTPVYIPVGTDNKIYSPGSFVNTQQPVLFMPGITRYNIPFDGANLVWQLKTYECFIKTVTAASACATSNRCNLYTAARSAGTNGVPAIITDPVKAAATEIIPGGSSNVYPNPAKNRTTIYIANELLTVKGLSLYDVYGNSYPVKMVRQVSKNAVEIDVSGLISGAYFMRVKVKDGYKTIAIIKE